MSLVHRSVVRDPCSSEIKILKIWLKEEVLGVIFIVGCIL